MNTQRTHRNALAAICLVLLSACASDSENLREERDDMSDVRCANGQPLTCIEKMGKKISCTCEGRDGLERLTKGGLRNW